MRLKMAISDIVIGSVPVDLKRISDPEYLRKKRDMLLQTYGQHVDPHSHVVFYIDNVPSRLNNKKQ